MKISSTQESLFERLREAYEEPSIESVKSDESQPPSIGAKTPAPTSPENERIQEIALRALNDEFDTEAAVKAAVVRELLSTRFANLDETAIEKVVDALIDDPEFERQVEDMLVLAARECAKRPLNA